MMKSRLLLRRLRRFLPGLLLGSVLMLVGCNTSVRQHPSFDGSQPVINYAVLPPQVEVKLIEFDGDSPDLEEDKAEVEAEILAAIQPILSEKGYEGVVLHKEAAHMGDPAKLAEIQEAYQTLMEELYAKHLMKPADALATQRDLGPIFNELAEEHGIDAVVLIDFVKYKKSSGVIAKDVAVSLVAAAVFGAVIIPQTEYSVCYVGVFDAASGELLYCNMLGNVPGSGKDVLKAVLKPIPEQTIPEVVPEHDPFPLYEEPTEEPTEPSPPEIVTL